MKLEPSSSETLISLNNELQSVDIPQVVIPVTSVPESSDDLAPDGEEVALAKAPTLMLHQELDQQAEVEHKSAVAPTTIYYVQGVVMGPRACIITNLIGDTSQTLFQPQMVWTIGRNREAALPLRDRLLSRRHAVILYVPDEGFHLIDLNSMNGTFLNGVRVQQRQLLQDSDVLRMGSIEFSFFISGNSRSIEPIHPEVLARFTNLSSRTEKFIDYSALEEPEVLFSTTREG